MRRLAANLAIAVVSLAALLAVSKLVGDLMVWTGILIPEEGDSIVTPYTRMLVGVLTLFALGVSTLLVGQIREDR